MRILVLVAEAHGGFGGVARYSQDLVEALASLPYVSSVRVHSRLRREEPVILPAKVDMPRSSSGGLLSFFAASAKEALFGNYDLILCAHANLLPFAAMIRAGRKTPIASVLFGTEAWVPSRRHLQNRMARRSNLVIAISDYTAQRFSAWSGVAEDHIHLLPNAISLDDFGPGAKPSYLCDRYGVGDRKILFTFGRLDAREKQKGFDELIAAMPDLLRQQPNLLLLIGGDGDDRLRLEQVVVRANLSAHVQFLGRISEAEKADHYRLADAFSLIGRQEGFGFVLLEALACGIPSIASSLDGSAYALRHGELGAIANPDVRESIVAAVLHAVDAPRRVPAGLSFFSFENFVLRLDGILQPQLLRNEGS